MSKQHLTQAQRDRLNAICKRFRLNAREHVTVTDDFKIINRAGIGRIRDLERIEINYKLEYQFEKYVTIHGTGRRKGVPDVDDGELPMIYEDYGETSPENCTFKFPVAVAKKRCESRIVLEMVGLYSEGFRGQDEMENQPIPKKSNVQKDGGKATQATLDKLKNGNRKVKTQGGKDRRA